MAEVATLEPPVRAVDPRTDPWLRSAEVELVGVSFPERTIEVIVIPYEREALVGHPGKPDAPPVKEVISRGAFDGIERRANRVKANRDHDTTRLFGHAAAFYPKHETGLKAKIRVARTDLGTETLELASNGDLDVSAGFVPLEELQWETRERYRVTKAFLHHVALVPDGAYGEDAGVLAVRAGSVLRGSERAATPRADAYRTRLLQEQYAALDARWQVRPPGR